jgi:hypothetical protein
VCKSADWKLNELKKELSEARLDVQCLLFVIDDICEFLDDNGHCDVAGQVRGAAVRFKAGADREADHE